MVALTPGLFVVPVGALAGALGLYAYFLKRATNKPVFRRFVGTGAVLAFLLNYAWELSHCTLYQGISYDLPHVAFLALASLADTIMAGLLYFGFALVYRNGLWARHLPAERIFWLVVAGGTGAILSEVAHLAAGNWAYATRMPIIPGIGVGLTPVLQFMVLPVLIYSLSARFTAPSAAPPSRSS
ncbi:hypothetical protein Q3A66_17335 [Hymenobacter sp. BT770]|uniref:hypothetical protein n=1 Tax=Hymenobacter sp. BT770 TaxID=2886942 RepID=UPI001D1068B8|nr:hypothetical protein [Hymenobacter sp. BT770]MCC3154938.1 hypothetical protein [Hymenobacter sp. BT770]MDO3416834.1 hypothetical protein [Hymenobacter sp. BT770]